MVVIWLQYGWLYGFSMVWSSDLDKLQGQQILSHTIPNSSRLIGVCFSINEIPSSWSVWRNTCQSVFEEEPWSEAPVPRIARFPILNKWFSDGKIVKKKVPGNPKPLMLWVVCFWKLCELHTLRCDQIRSWESWLWLIVMRHDLKEFDRKTIGKP